MVGGRPLYQHVAENVARDWNGNGNCALVVGATWPEQLREVRAIVGDMPILVPGVGAQGGDVEAVVRNATTADGTGLLVSSSRAILYASSATDFAEAAAPRRAALRDDDQPLPAEPPAAARAPARTRAARTESAPRSSRTPRRAARALRCGASNLRK